MVGFILASNGVVLAVVAGVLWSLSDSWTGRAESIMAWASHLVGVVAVALFVAAPWFLITSVPGALLANGIVLAVYGAMLASILESVDQYSKRVLRGTAIGAGVAALALLLTFPWFVLAA